MFTFEELQKAAKFAVIVGAVFGAFIIFVWPHTDMVKQAKKDYENQRANAIATLREWYIVAPYLTQEQRYDIMRQYHITERDLTFNWDAYNAK